MRISLIILICCYINNPLTIQFSSDCRACDDWYVVLDGVMGGLSSGMLEKTQNSFILRGEISLKNNGGFASLRSPYKDFDLSSYSKVIVRYRSKGQDFGITLNKYRRFWYPNYKVNLPQTSGEWKVVAFNLKEFNQYRLGRRVEGNPTADDLSKIIRLGFISNTKAESIYEFEVDYMKFE